MMAAAAEGLLSKLSRLASARNVAACGGSNAPSTTRAAQSGTTGEQLECEIALAANTSDGRQWTAPPPRAPTSDAANLPSIRSSSAAYLHDV
jgi:hypothetical protein